jgi:oligopeptide transport system substrate-binding protein
MIRRLFLTALLIAPLACGGGKGSTTADTTTLRVGNGGEPKSLDPQLVTGLIEERLLSSLFEGLVNVDLATMQPLPGVAESWTVSPDGYLYTFHLRTDAKWSNGDPVTAEDFVYSWRRMLSPPLAAEYAYMLYIISRAEAFNRGMLTDFSQVGVKALDARTLEVRLQFPAPYFLLLQIHFSFYPVHRATIEKHGKMTDRDTPWTRPGNHVSNGPFHLTAWTPNKEIVVDKNRYYWGRDAVRLKRIVYQPIQDPTVEERMFRSGELDVTNALPLAKVETYQKNQPEILRTDPTIATEFIRFNTTRKPFDDARVRLAFAYAIDREALVKHVLKGGQTLAETFVPPNLGGYVYGTHAKTAVAATRHSYDPARAKALMAEAGYPNGAGFPAVTMIFDTNDNNRRYCEALQDMWKTTLGVQVQLQNMDGKSWLASMIALDYDLARSLWSADYPDPSNFLEMFYSSSGNNRTGYREHEYENSVRRAALTADPAERNALFDDAERRLLTASPISPVYYRTRPFLKSLRVEGLTPNNLDRINWRGLALKP